MPPPPARRQQTPIRYDFMTIVQIPYQIFPTTPKRKELLV